MPPEILEQWSKITRTTLDAVKELGELNSKLFERVSEQQLELVHASVDAGVKSARLVGETRSYQEFAAAQAALANEYGERVLQIVRKSNQVVGGLRDEYVSWMEGQVRQTVGPLAKPAATPGKKAA